MRGLGGWQSVGGPARVQDPLNLFGQILVDPRAWRMSTAGLAVSTAEQSTFLLSAGECAVALVGRAHWRDGGESITDIARVCQRLLDAYGQKRADALQSLHGEFAVALVDNARNETLLAIDRFGIQNLVYQAKARQLIFGSSCDVVLRHPDADGTVDPQAIYDYGYFHVVPGPRTIYHGLSRLLPGHYLVFADGQATARPYWTMRFAEQPGSVADFKPRFRQVLRDAVAESSRGANCGAFLSGGTDSSTVAGLLGQVSGAAANTFSIGFAVEGYDEMDYARIASRHFGTKQHEYYVTPDDVLSALPLITGAYDQPFGNASAVAAYYCAKLAQSKGVTRMLAGDGGDELFGGNSRYAKQHQLAYYEKVPAPARSVLEMFSRSPLAPQGLALVRKMRSYIDQASRPMPARYDSYNLIDYIGAQNLFTPEFLSRIDTGAPLKLLQETHAPYREASLINQMLGIDFKLTLADSDLPKVTRMCELAGVEVAFPLLDEAVVEFSGILPARLKLRGTQLRYFFKEALRDFLPGEILRKEKHGFGLPAGAWLMTHPGLKSFATQNLSRLKHRGIVAPGFIDRLLTDYVRTHAAYFGTMAWVLLTLELWFQSHPNAKV